VVWKALDVRLGMLAIALAMALGGVLAAAKVAKVMSQSISAMTNVQALTANFVAAALVIAASRFGLPVSTTHVTVAAITGIGMSNGSADFGAIKKILASWLVTLPIAACLAALFALCSKAF
jgi:inorganic phosphate transporter, PiT family